MLSGGSHTFTFHAGPEANYVLSATASGVTRSIKLVSAGGGREKVCGLEYNGMASRDPGYKSAGELAAFVFSPGDLLQFIGYSTTAASVIASDVMEDAPESSAFYSFQIVEGVPCSGTPVVHWQGQTYGTIQVGSQCWMRENLNWETGSSWCYGNDPANCETYGRLYNWETIMNGAPSSSTVPSGVQGICPDGWHIPSDMEWCILTQEIDPTMNCNASGWSGTDAGVKMKSTTGWNSSSWNPNGNGTNESGFTGRPAGQRNTNGTFSTMGELANFWTSTEYDGYEAWYRNLVNYDVYVDRWHYYKTYGFSVRCVRD